MIEHCTPQCSSMYRSALRALSEYVVHRSNWTMIDDVTFPSPPLLLVSSPLLLSLSLLLLCLSHFFPFPLRKVVILRKLNIALETYNPQGSFYLSLAYSRPLSLFPSSLAFLSLPFFLFLSLSTISKSSPLLCRYFSSSHSLFLSLFLFLYTISICYLS